MMYKQECCSFLLEKGRVTTHVPASGMHGSTVSKDALEVLWFKHYLFLKGA